MQGFPARASAFASMHQVMCVPAVAGCVITEEWRHLAGLHADKAGVVALVLGAVLLAPLTEVSLMG